MDNKASEAPIVPTVVKKHFVQVDGRGPLPGRGPHAQRACRKDVRLVVLDGSVRGIELTCSCGETTLIELEYPAAATPASQARET
jgi:hypothetical protein